MTSAVSKTKLSVKFQTLGALISIVAAVAVPQVLHLLGAASGIGTALGEVFLPMHLPINVCPQHLSITELLAEASSHLDKK